MGTEALGIEFVTDESCRFLSKTLFAESMTSAEICEEGFDT